MRRSQDANASAGEDSAASTLFNLASSQGGGGGGAGLRRSHACAVCAKGKRRCDGNRPCSRCKRLGIEHKCVDPDASMMPSRKRKSNNSAQRATTTSATKRTANDGNGTASSSAKDSQTKSKKKQKTESAPTRGRPPNSSKKPVTIKSKPDVVNQSAPVFSHTQYPHQPHPVDKHRTASPPMQMYSGLPPGAGYHPSGPMTDMEASYSISGSRVMPFGQAGASTGGYYSGGYTAPGIGASSGMEEAFSLHSWQTPGNRFPSVSDASDYGYPAGRGGFHQNMRSTQGLNFTMAPMSSTSKDGMPYQPPLPGGTMLTSADGSFTRSSPSSFDDVRRRSSSANSDDLLTSTFRAMAEGSDQDVGYFFSGKNSPFSEHLYNEIEQYNSPVLYVLYNGPNNSTPKRIYLNTLAQDLFGRSVQDVRKALSKDENVIWIHPKFAPMRHEASTSARSMGVQNYEFKGKYLRKLPTERGQTQDRFSVFEAREHISVELDPRKRHGNQDGNDESGLGVLMKFTEIRECTDEIIVINEDGIPQQEALKDGDESKQRRHSFLMTMVNKDPTSTFGGDGPGIGDTRKRTDSSESGLSNMSLTSMCDDWFGGGQK